MNRWFRFYDDAINDPKLLRLSDGNFRAWITLLCIASKCDGVLPPTADIALMLRVKPTRVAEWLAMLIAGGLIDKTETGFAPHNWNARQFKSDVSTERVKRFRKQERNVSETANETAPDTEQKQITETEQSRETRARRATRLPNDWTLSENDLAFAAGKGLATKQIATEALKFLNYWTSKGGQGATKTDWSKTWQNWILTTTQGVPTNGRRKTVQDANDDLIAEIRALDEPAPGGLCGDQGEIVVRLLPPR
jgi:hypothetical protein